MNLGRPESSVTRLRYGELRNRFQEGALDFVSPSRRAPRLWDPTQSPNQWVLFTVFTVSKRAARGADHSPPTTAARTRRGAMRVITVPS